MLVYQKTMFDRYNYINSFCHLKPLKKTLRKVHYCIAVMARKSMKNTKVLNAYTCM